MAIKGTVKIELFDAATGAKTDEVISSNMVTNAVRNIVNPDRALVDGGEYTSFGTVSRDIMEKWVGATSPIGRKLFKGIMLFNKKLTENVDNIIPDASTREAMIGCGGGGSTLAGNSFRGTYNNTESRELSNGYSHVWDFATDQANGVINAVALTSEWGGEMGWRASEYEMAKSLVPITGENSWLNSVSALDVPASPVCLSLFRNVPFPYSASSDGGYRNAICSMFVANGVLYEVVIRDDRKQLEVYRKSLTNALRLKESLWTAPVEFTDDIPALREGASKLVFTSVNGFCASSASNVNVCLIPNGVMFASFSSNADMTIINTTSVSLVDGEVTVNSWGITTAIQTINLTRTYAGCAVDGDYIYVASGAKGYLDKIYKLKMHGNKEESELTMPYTPASSTERIHMGTFLDTIFVCKPSADVYYLLDSTRTSFTNKISAFVSGKANGKPMYYVTNETAPWVLLIGDLKITNEVVDGLIPVIVAPYLATINNLQKAVTKTASKTMKITYTIQNT